VYLARDLQDDSRVALKLLHQEFAGSKAAERFALETRLLREFEHGAILPVRDAGEWKGRPFYVMPFVDGESLQARIKRERRLPFDEVVRIGKRLCDALAYAHERKVVHRDVKPANVMLAGDAVYLTDFGIAKALEPVEGAPHSTTGVARGTRAYMSPEQVTADRDLDHRSDIFSLGCVLYEMIAGVRPFYSADEARELMRRLMEAPDPLKRHRDGVPVALERVVMKALAREPADRWQGVGEMGEGLGREGKLGVRPRPTLKGAMPWLAAGAVVLFLVSPYLRRGTMPSSAAAALGPGSDRVTLFVEPLREIATDAETRVVVQRIEREMLRLKVRWSDVDVRLTPGPASGATSSEAVVRIRWHAEVAGDSAVLKLFGAKLDPREPTPSASITFGRDESPNVSMAFMQLLRPAPLLHRTRWQDSSTVSLLAWRQFADGHALLTSGRFERSDSLLTEAVRRDPAYLEAWRFLALARMWRVSGGSDAATEAATRLVAAQQMAPGRVAPLDSAILLLARSRYADVRARLRGFEAVASDSALLELLAGHAHAWDAAITRVGGRRTFAGSYWSAAQAFERALLVGDRATTSAAFSSLRRVWFVENTRVRVGRMAIGSEQFAAYPSWEGDSIAFWPMTFERMATGPSDPELDRRNRAVRYGTERLRLAAETWSSRFAQDPRAWEALSLAAEASGALGEGPAHRVGALQALERARTLEVDPERNLALAVANVRLLLKTSQWALARSLSDSLLDAGTSEVADSPARLAPIAALVGRVDQAIEYFVRSEGALSLAQGNEAKVVVPPALRRDASEAFVIAATGTCDERLPGLFARIDSVIMRVVSPAEQPAARSQLVDWSASLAVPCTNAESVRKIATTGDYLIEAQKKLLAGDKRGVVDVLSRVARRRRLGRPGDIALDVAYQEAWLMLAIGDSSSSAERLEGILQSLPLAGPSLTSELSQSAALRRILQTAGGLARARADTTAARRWSAVLDTLSGPREPTR